MLTDRLISEIKAILESKKAHPFLTREDSTLQEVLHEQKYHKLGFSSAIVAKVTNVGDPRLVIPNSACSLFYLKKTGQHGRPMTGLFVPCNVSYALDGFPPSVSSVIFGFLLAVGVLCFCFVAPD